MKRKKGFSLLEVLITVAIIAVVAIATAYGFISIANMRVHAYHTSIASFLAQDKLEGFKTVSYDNISDSAANEQIGLYTRSWTVSEASGLKTIIVTVDFPSIFQDNSITLTTIRASY